VPSSHSARSLAAILFTDIVGYSKLVHRDDASALRLLAEHFRMVREAARQFGGREIKTIGDSVHLEFASAQTATTCAIAIQKLHQQRNARMAAEQQFEIRIGLHLGDVEHRDGDVYGDGVNIAARLQPLAPVGGIAISDDVRRQLPEELRDRFVSRGAQDLKNIDTPVGLFVVEAGAIAALTVVPPTSAPQVPERSRSNWRYALIAIGILSLIPLMMFAVALMPHLRSKDSTEKTKVADKSIAVLPFESLSEEKANAYFADGVQDQILTGLSKIGDLKVISRTSTQRYASKPDNLSQIARELGVAHILEGSVQRAGNRVRINVQLIDARSDNHLWADTYDRDLDDIFAVQSEVAQKIADSLSATLTQRERAALVQKPTDNVQAYNAYLRGRVLSARVITTRAHADEILATYREAVRLDPGFALAWAELVGIAILTTWSGLDPSGELQEESRQALARATVLAPKLPQVQMSRAIYLYYGERDFKGALAIMNSLKSELPGDAGVWVIAGLLARRTGAWDQAIADMARAATLQPNDPALTYNLGATHAAMFDFARGVALMDATLALQPDAANALSQKLLYLILQGDLDKAEQALASIDPNAAVVQALRGTLALYRRDYATASRFLRRAVASGDDSRLDCWFDGFIPASTEWQLLLGLSEQRAGAHAAARTLFEQVKATATRVLASKMETRYVEAEWHLALGMALAGLGEREQAAAEGERAVAMMPYSVDPLEAPHLELYLSRINGWNGDAARVVPLAQKLMRTNGSFMTAELLRLDPRWDPVRDDPGFQALVKQ
jgi:TolB-like protein/class 3 adenylate cyclase/Flp pilus assembly protein TadD